MSTEWPERIDVGDRIADHDQEAHRARYAWAAPRVGGVVVDVACGTGHGSALLARVAESVVGFDRSEQAVAAARLRCPGGEFAFAAAPPIPRPDASADAVVTFETVEHIEDDRGFVAELRRVLKPGGRLLLSTPNRALTSPNTFPPPNPFHVREYLLPDLLDLVRGAGFADVEVFHQDRQRAGVREHVAAAVLAHRPGLCRPGSRLCRLGHGTGEVVRWDERVKHPLVWVLQCAAAP